MIFINQTLRDIQYLLAEMLLAYDGVGISAYDKSNFKTLSERYGFSVTDVDEAIQLKNKYMP